MRHRAAAQRACADAIVASAGANAPATGVNKLERRAYNNRLGMNTLEGAVRKGLG